MTNSENPRICEKCSGALESDANFCPQCGVSSEAHLKSVNLQETVPTDHPSMQSAEEIVVNDDSAEIGAAFTQPSAHDVIVNEFNEFEKSNSWAAIFLLMMWAFLLITYFF